MALREEEFERLQTQLLELKTSNYSLLESNSRKDVTISQLQSRSEELEKELVKMQTLAKMNPLSYAKSIAARKDARDKESAAVLRRELETLTAKMESQESEFKKTNDFLKKEIQELLVDNQKLRDFVEEVESGPGFLKLLQNQSNSCSGNSIIMSPASSSYKIRPVTSDEGDIGKSTTLDQASQFSLIAERERLNNQLLDMQHEVKRISRERDVLMEQMTILSDEHNELKDKFDQVTILAEERRKTIHDMRTKMEETRVKHSEEMDSMKKEHSDEVDQLREQIAILIKLQGELEDTRQSLTLVQHEKEDCEQQLTRVRQEFEENRIQKEYYESRISDLSRESESKLLLLQETQAAIVQEMEEKISNAQEEIDRLNQAAADSIEDRKIHEKKAVKMMKELKRNLDNEKNRASKLQQKLQEFLSQTSLDPTDYDFDEANRTSGGGGNGSEASASAHPASGHLLMSSSTSTPLKSGNVNSVPASSSVVQKDGYGSRSSMNSNATGSRHQSDERLNDTSSAGSWSFMSNSGNGANGNGIDTIGTGLAVKSTRTAAAAAAGSSDHSDGSNDFAPTSSITTASPYSHATARHHHRQQQQQQLHHLSSSSSSPARAEAAAVMIARDSGQHRDAVDGVGMAGNSGSDVLSLIQELECENRQLVSRITDLKQENWALEERVNQLLTQVDSMTIDIRNKGLIIEFYCMGGDPNSRDRSVSSSSSNMSLSSTSAPSPSSSSGHNHQHHHPPSKEKMTVRKVVDFIKDRGDENLKEINRKLQRLLEETLTKNMFLQQDLESMSHEVVRLSKESVNANAAPATASS